MHRNNFALNGKAFFLVFAEKILKKQGAVMKFVRILPVVTVFAASAAFAQQATAPGPIDRVKITDNELSCAQIHGEIGDMDKVVGEARAIEAKQKTNTTAAGAAGTAAEVAGRTGLFGAIGGLTGHLFGQLAAQTAAGAVQQTSAQSAQQAGERARQAVARKEHLTGLFLAKDCKASDPNAAGRALSGEELQKLTAAGAAAAAADAGPAKAPADAQGAAALVNEAAATARPASIAASELSEDRVRELVGRAQKVAIGGYRVAFVIQNSAAAYAGAGLSNMGQSTGNIRTITQSQNRRIDVALDNITPALMQSITDRLYADFVEKLKASGREVVPFEQVGSRETFRRITVAEAKPGGSYTSSPTGDRRNFVVMAPTGMPLWFIHGDPLGNLSPISIENWRAASTLSHELQATIVTAQVIVDFARMESSGRSNIATRASVGAEPQMSIAPGYTTLTAFHATRADVGDFSAARLKSVLNMDGDFATVRQGDSHSTAGLANSLTMVTGLQGVQISRDRQAYVADPGKYAGLALGGGFGVNALLASVVKGK